jgi:predicted Zn-dependent protease
MHATNGTNGTDQSSAAIQRWLAGDEAAWGEWLHEHLVAAYGLETEAWASERVLRVTERLNRERWGGPPIRAEIVWLQAMTAFAAPGRYVYLSRELLQRLDSDDAVAFVVAHEMAHHDLGHLRLFTGWWRNRLRAALPSAGATVVAAMYRALEHKLIGPERERAADTYALDLCIVAGYDPERCLDVFLALESHALDLGDLDIVFGPDEAPGALPADLRRWGWQRGRGYPSLRERVALLRAHEEALAATGGVG